MIFASRFALTTFLTVSLAGAALAAPVAVPAADKPTATETPVAKPLSAWLVGPSQASQFEARDNPDEQGCLMVTEFDNGMIVGVHARKAGIVGMTVDTKNPVLTTGEAKPVGFNLGQDAYVVNAVASDTSTLSLGFEEAGGGRKVAERLTGLGNFRLLIDEKPYYFATTGFTDGLARLQACMGGTMAVSVPVTGPGDTAGKVIHETGIEYMKVTSSGHETPLALAMPNLVPSGYKFVLDDVDPMTPVSWQAGEDWVEVMRKALEPHDLKMSLKGQTVRISQRTGDADPVIEDAQLDDAAEAEALAAVPADVPVGVWGGAKGESLATVLEAWGLMAGVNVRADLEGDLKLPQDVRYEGRFDEAVQKLLAQFNGRNKPVGSFRGMAAKPEVVEASARIRDTWKRQASEPRKFIPKKIDPAAPKPWAPLKQMSTIPDPPGAPKKVDAQGKAVDGKGPAKSGGGKKDATWAALEGTSLRDVLEQWGQDAGVNIVWMADENYPLPKTIRKSGKFEDAVVDVLGQYEGQGARPVAQLNSDPATGEKALIIKTKRL